ATEIYTLSLHDALPIYDRATVGGCALRDADFRVGRHIGVLIVGCNDPVALAIDVNDVVDRAVVLYRRGESLVGCLPIVPPRHETQRMRSIGVSQRPRQPSVAVGIETVVPAEGRRELAHGLV